MQYARSKQRLRKLTAASLVSVSVVTGLEGGKTVVVPRGHRFAYKMGSGSNLRCRFTPLARAG